MNNQLLIQFTQQWAGKRTDKYNLKVTGVDWKLPSGDNIFMTLGSTWHRWWAHANYLNSMRPRQNRRHFAGDIFKCIFLNENERISLRISPKFVPYVRINNIPSLIQIMAWRRPGDKPLSEPMMVSLLTHICVTRPQWVKCITQSFTPSQL